MTIIEEFDAFWAVYPRHIAKQTALKAFTRARQRASFQELVDGVRRYIQGKPSYADWCHAATWLNQARWQDEWPGAKRTALDWWTECQRVHGGTCVKRWDHEWKMKEGGE